MTGRGGETCVVLLPVGTMVTDLENHGELVVDLTCDGQEFLLCKGGKGGFGNAHFTSSTRQAPNFAELGDEGEEMHVKFELKLVADVGLIGMPNAGKSSLISSITNVRPKIANYPFTTIIPNLGVMEYKGRGLLIEDVPGLIEGASEGKGLGIQFLKHIERTALLCHLLDLGNTDEEIMTNYTIIRKELRAFSPTLAEKPEIIILSKVDLVPPDEQKARIAKLKKKFKGADVFAISAPMMEGVEALQNFLIKKIPAGQREMQIQEEALRALKDEQPEAKIYDLKAHRNTRTISIRRKDIDTFEVFGERIEEIARMTNMQNKESIARMIDVLDREKVLSKIMSMLNVDQDRLKDSYFEGSADIASDPKVIIAERVFHLGDLQFR